VDIANILVIEDDDIVARTIERCLRGGEFHVLIANSGVEGLQLARRNPPNLVILDVIMPGMDGYAVCREMRADPILSEVPILFLTAKAKDEDRITGFTAGADDYLSKPFNLDELRLRIRAILRRTRTRAAVASQDLPEGVRQATAPDAAATSDASKTTDKSGRPIERSLRVRGFVLDTRTYELTTPQDVKIRLTPVQFDLLYHLMSHPGEIFSPPRLLDEVWDYPTDAGSPDLVRVHIKNLRERIEIDPKAPTFIETVQGYGYTIRVDG
jgi:two-component system, OmpR family, response regulator RpaA